MILIQYSKTFVATYLQKYSIFFLLNFKYEILTQKMHFFVTKILEIYYFLHLTSNVIISLLPEPPSCSLSFRSPCDLFMVTIGQGVIQALCLISRPFLMYKWPIKLMSRWTNWPQWFCRVCQVICSIEIHHTHFTKIFQNILYMIHVWIWAQFMSTYIKSICNIVWNPIFCCW